MRIIIMLNIQHLTKVYGEKKAVDDLSLHIAPGEIYGFIGHNGAGKTTTLRSVVGILQFDAGEITIGGKSIRTDPIACKRELAYIPDNPDLYDYMTGIRYLNFIADIFGVSSEVRGQRIHDYAARFELTDDLAQPIAAYSHGMKQKLAIISAWLHQPRLIIMDEPFVGLDPKASHLLKAVRCRSISSALLDRELRRFTSSANYMLNCGFGTLFLVLASGFLLWQGRELLELVSQSFPERSGAMPVLLAFVLCLLSAMNDTTAPSVSLEGKQLWLAQSLPVSPWQVLRAKLRLQLLITIPPMLLCLVCLLAVYPGSPLELLFIAVTALSYALLMALLGLFLGLKMPNLSWTNEVVPIKQSACVALSLFSGWAVAMIPGALYLLTGIGSLDPLLYLSVVTALVLILSAVLSLWVKKTGSCIFAAL